MPPGKQSLAARVRQTAAPFLQERERVLRAAEAMKGPRTIWAALLGPIGFLLLLRPRHVALTNRRLIVAIPPARGGGVPKLDVALDRVGTEVVEHRVGRLWVRLVLRDAEGRRVPLNFARVWRGEAEALRRRLSRRGRD